MKMLMIASLLCLAANMVSAEDGIPSVAVHHRLDGALCIQAPVRSQVSCRISLHSVALLVGYPASLLRRIRAL